MGIIVPILPELEFDPAPKNEVIVVVSEVMDLADQILEGLVDLLILRFWVSEDDVIEDIFFEKAIDGFHLISFQLMVLNEFDEVIDYPLRTVRSHLLTVQNLFF